MDLFFLRALVRGKLATTAKFEETLNQVAINAKRYRQVEQSDELKEFNELEKKVTAADFQMKKKEIKGAVYKNSAEAKTLADFTALCKDKYVRAYLREGKEPERPTVERYLALKAQIESADFQKRNEFWKDPHRWENSEDGKMEARYEALKKNDDIIFFNKADVKNVERWEQFDLAFNEDFEWVNVKNSPWKPGFIYPNETFINDHSYGNEVQAYCNGRNVDTNNSILTIRTKKEPCEGRAWEAGKGMYMKQFSYSSDALYTDAVEVTEGSVVQVKCRCRGLLNHGVYLRSRNHIPFISVFDYTGLKLYCGVKDSLKNDKNMKLLDGLQPIVYTIFTLSWQKDEIVWFVNNLEVCRMKNLIPAGEKLYLHLYSFQFEGARVSEGELNVDWLRVYNVKK